MCLSRTKLALCAVVKFLRMHSCRLHLFAQVYADNKSFEYEEDLREEIVHEWEIDRSLLRTYIKSIPKRCMDVAENRG
eukprot:IDg9207t1